MLSQASGTHTPPPPTSEWLRDSSPRTKGRPGSVDDKDRCLPEIKQRMIPAPASLSKQAQWTGLQRHRAETLPPGHASNHQRRGPGIQAGKTQSSICGKVDDTRACREKLSQASERRATWWQTVADRQHPHSDSSCCVCQAQHTRVGGLREEHRPLIL